MGTVIKRIRKQRKLSQESLGKLVGCSGKHISEIESGIKIALPHELESIAAALGVKVDDLRYREAKYRL